MVRVTGALGRTPGVFEVCRLIFLMVECKRLPHSAPIMEKQQPRMTKQGVRDLDFGKSTKRQGAAEAKSVSSPKTEAPAVPLEEVVPPSATAAPLEK